MSLLDVIRANSHDDLTRMWTESQSPKMSDPVGKTCHCGCPPPTFRDVLAADGALLDPPPRITVETWEKMIDLGIVDISVLYEMAKSLNSTPRWVQFDKILRLFDRNVVRDFRSEYGEPLIFCMFYMMIPDDASVLMPPIRYLIEECGFDVNTLRPRSGGAMENDDGERADSLFEVVIGTCSRPELCEYLISKGADINYCGGHSGRGFCLPFAWRVKQMVSYIYDKRWESDDEDDEDEDEDEGKARRVKSPLDRERLEACLPNLLKMHKILKEHGYNYGPDPRDKKQRTVSYYVNKHKLLEVDPRFGELLN